MKKVLGITFFFLFSFCSKRESTLPRIIVPDVDNVVEVNTKGMLNNRPTLLGINFLNDTILIKKNSNEKERSIVYLNADTILPKYNLKIIIDTSYTFHSKGFNYTNLPWPKPDENISELYPNQIEREQIVFKPYLDGLDKLRSTYVSSFPVLIYNLSNSNVYISTPSSIGDFHFIQQAKDADGKWKPIEFQKGWYNFGCGTSYNNNPNYLLLPKHFLATSTIKYSGNFKTKIRIKMYSGNNYYYSNEVIGYINKSQFNQDFIKEYLKIRGFEQDLFVVDKDLMFLDIEKYLHKKHKF